MNSQSQTLGVTISPADEPFIFGASSSYVNSLSDVLPAGDDKAGCKGPCRYSPSKTLAQSAVEREMRKAEYAEIEMRLARANASITESRAVLFNELSSLAGPAAKSVMSYLEALVAISEASESPDQFRVRHGLF